VQTELLTRKHAGNSIPWVLVRPTSVWGPWFDIPYRDFFDMVRRRLYTHPRGQKIFKSYSFVGNMVYQLDRLMFDPGQATNQTVYLCDPPLEVLHWAQLVAGAFNVPAPTQVPYGLLALAARAGDLLKRLGYSEPPLTSFRLDNLVTDMVVDYMLAPCTIDSLPFDIEEATAVTQQWMAEGISTSQRSR
jgi:hypothetical protein